MYDEIFAQQLQSGEEVLPLRNFRSVTTSTDLSGLNLNWREADLPEALRTKHVHRLHPYLGKFIPQLVEIFLRKFEPRLVYDPFLGSGTTAVEANALGVACVGTDISAFNVLVSKVKTDAYDIEVLGKEAYRVLIALKAHRQNSQQDAGTNNVQFIANDYVKKWFGPQSQKDLLFYLNETDGYTYRDVFRIILSRAARSARLVKHFDLDFPNAPQTEPYQCFKHSRVCSPVQDAQKFLERYSADTITRIRSYSRIKSNAEVMINHGDSREVDLPRGIDLVITSPPYLGLIDYHEQHRYAYELLGIPMKADKEIGPAFEGQSQRAKAAYKEAMQQVFLHTREFMAPSGKMVIVVNDKHKLYDAALSGFKEVNRLERHVNRRTGRRQTPFFESILIWEKA